MFDPPCHGASGTAHQQDEFGISVDLSSVNHEIRGRGARGEVDPRFCHSGRKCPEHGAGFSNDELQFALNVADLVVADGVAFKYMHTPLRIEAKAAGQWLALAKPTSFRLDDVGVPYATKRQRRRRREKHQRDWNHS